MSMKVYNGFKYVGPKKEFWSYIETLRSKAQVNVARNVVALVQSKLEKAWSREMATPFKVWDGIYSKVKDQANQFSRDNYDPACSFTVFPYKGGFYLRAYSDRVSDITRDALGFFESEEYLTDYHYQNQSDKPEEISARDWNTRKKVWSALYENNSAAGYGLNVHVSSFETFYSYNPTYDDVFKGFKVKTILDDLARVDDLLRKSPRFKGYRALPKNNPITGPMIELLARGKPTLTFSDITEAYTYVEVRSMSERDKKMVERFIRRPLYSE